MPGRGGNGNDYFINLFGFESFFKLVDLSNDRHTINVVILFCGIIVEKTNRDEIELRCLLQLTHHQRASIACTEDESMASLGVGLRG